MTHKSLRDFPTFKNDHQSTEKTIPGKFWDVRIDPLMSTHYFFSAELIECPMCQCMPELTTQGQISRARNWIQGSTVDQ